MRKFTKEISALLATVAVGTSVNAATAASENEAVKSEGVAMISDTELKQLTTTMVGTTVAEPFTTIYEDTYVDGEMMPPDTYLSGDIIGPPVTEPIYTVGTEIGTTTTTTTDKWGGTTMIGTQITPYTTTTTTAETTYFEGNSTTSMKEYTTTTTEDTWFAGGIMDIHYGDANAEAMAKWHNQPAETWLAFRAGRFEKLPHGRKVTEVEGFAEGAFVVQDPATAEAVAQLDVTPGQSVLDFCAAPGGKTAQVAWRLNGTGRLVAQEVNPKRLARLKENMARLRLDSVEVTQSVAGIGVRTVFDRVLVDAPCSNTGVLRRRPDARWRWSVDHLKQLVGLQAQILDAAAAYVAPGGRIVYSTCSNEPEENGEQVAAFLARHEDFTEVGRRESVPFETGHDGAFACAMERRRT